MIRTLKEAEEYGTTNALMAIDQMEVYDSPEAIDEMQRSEKGIPQVFYAYADNVEDGDYVGTKSRKNKLLGKAWLKYLNRIDKWLRAHGMEER